MKLRHLLCVFALVVYSIPAFAAEPVFLPGLRIGMTPMMGLTKATNFPGFESRDHVVRVLVTELPAAAFTDIDNAVKANAPGVSAEPIETGSGVGYYHMEGATNGDNSIKRFTIVVAGKDFAGGVMVLMPEKASETYPDAMVKQMLASVVTRSEVPVDELLQQLPFKVTELAGFKNVHTQPSGLLTLSDAEPGAELETAPVMVIRIIGGTPAEADDRARFARDQALQIPGMRDVRTTVAEPMRINGTPGYETRIEAVTGKNKIEVTVVQWLRFNGGISLQIIASSPRDQWSTAFPRFREVRDGIQSKNGS